MSKDEKKRYEFHFKIDLVMRKELEELDLYKEEGSFSRLIVKILFLLAPCLEREHFLKKQRMSQYELVNDDLEISRKSVHVYLPEFLYKQLKAMHHDLNYYSIAQLLRRMLRFFLWLIRCYGRRSIEDLKDILQQWEERNEKQVFSRKLIRQLLHFIYRYKDVGQYLSFYNNTFSLIGIFRVGNPHRKVLE